MAKVLYTAHAHVTGGRANGHGRSDDGQLEVDLRIPEEMGGPGGGTVALPSVDDRETAAQLIREAHQVCPYSNATRGNVDVDLLLNGEPL
jgi:organic hydroperoxide reductase OsmC/OhrA